MQGLLRNDASEAIEEALYDGRDYGYNQAREEEERAKDADRRLHTKRFVASAFLLLALVVCLLYFRVDVRPQSAIILIVGAVLCYLLQRIWKHDISFY